MGCRKLTYRGKAGRQVFRAFEQERALEEKAVFFRGVLEKKGHSDFFSLKAYIYGFNGKEKDTNLGGGTHYDYGFRIYNPRIAKFLSVDPLTKSYPMLTPYQFASNSPLAGIDLDGLEYLDYREARIELLSGTVFIKLENFSKIYQRDFRKNNPHYGLVYKNQDGTAYGEGMLETIIRPRTPARKIARLSNKTNDPAYDPTRITLKGTNRAARRQNDRKGAPILTTGPGASSGVAYSVILLNAINYSLELYVNTTLRNDQDALNSQIRDRSYIDIKGFFDEELITIEAPLNKALKDIQIALKDIIPSKNQNIDDLSAITNIVLFGGNGNESKELLEIGNKIIDDVCKCRKEGSNE